MKFLNIYTVLSACLLSLFAFAAYGCGDGHNSGDGNGGSHIYISVRTSINQDGVLWEDRVDELRMLAFESGNGQAVFNEKLYFPNGFSDKSRAVRLRPGTYDFYFIANESVYQGDFTSALMEVANMSDFTTDTRFTRLAYNPGFATTQSSPQGRFVMSAIYGNITVTSGGTEDNPAPLPLPTTKIELVRAMAKVEVVFRKRTPGSELPPDAITSVQINNVASYMSVPPLDDYYAGATGYSDMASLDGLNTANDSIGAVTFYIPEYLVPEGGADYTQLVINNRTFPILTDDNKTGILSQRRSVPALSNNSVVRNYHYTVNAYVNTSGEAQIIVFVEPWIKDRYIYIFQGDQQEVIPPVIPTDSSIIIPTGCGRVEILSANENLPAGLQGAYNDQVTYWDEETGGPLIKRGDPPYYCEQKYGTGWRLINSCELMYFLYYLDVSYNIWMSNTWKAQQANLPYYHLPFRQASQLLLERLTGKDLSGTVLYPENNWLDQMPDDKLDIIDKSFTPGDIVVREMDYPGGWPYEAPPGTNETWYYNEATITVRAFWYGSEYVSLADRGNWDKVLYGHFNRYDYSSTVSRCVRPVD